MKAVSETTAEEFRKSGAWDDMTLDALFRQTVEAHPDRLAICDAPDRADWTGGHARELTYAEADKEIDRLAAFFRTVGLSADHVIGVQAPNTVDAVISFHAGQRADLIVSPQPLHWRQKDVVKALNSVGAKGLVAADRVETRMVGTAARDAAADLFSLRFVFGLGKEVPDGLIELGAMLAEIGDDLQLEPSERQTASDHVATISWSRSGTTSEPLSRSHNHWNSAARSLLGELDLPEAPKLLVPYSLSGLTGLGSGLVPWLITGGTLHLHHPTSLAGMAQHANKIKADLVLTPGPLAQRLDKNLHPDATIVAAWNVAAPKSVPHVPKHPLVDIHVADEYGLVAKKRPPSGELEAISPGKQLGSEGRESGPAHLEIKATAASDKDPFHILMKGPMVPVRGWHNGPTKTNNKAAQEDTYLDTGLMAERKGEMITRFGLPGAYSPGAGELSAIDAIYSSYPEVSEAVAFLVEDELLGARIHAAVVPKPGAVPDAKAFFAFLDAEGVDLAKIPQRVLVLQSLPRTETGDIDRERLTMRTQRLPAKVA